MCLHKQRAELFRFPKKFRLFEGTDWALHRAHEARIEFSCSNQLIQMRFALWRAMSISRQIKTKWSWTSFRDASNRFWIPLVAGRHGVRPVQPPLFRFQRGFSAQPRNIFCSAWQPDGGRLWDARVRRDPLLSMFSNLDSHYLHGILITQRFLTTPGCSEWGQIHHTNWSSNRGGGHNTAAFFV